MAPLVQGRSRGYHGPDALIDGSGVRQVPEGRTWALDPYFLRVYMVAQVSPRRIRGRVEKLIQLSVGWGEEDLIILLYPICGDVGLYSTY